MLREPWSWRWVWASFAIYLTAEAILGGVMAPWVSGFVSRPMVMRVEVLMILGSFVCGGFVVGFISPRVRVLEPAVGASLAIGLTSLYAVFMPVKFYDAGSDKLLVGAFIAFVCAYLGADAGERASGRLGNRASQDYAGED